MARGNRRSKKYIGKVHMHVQHRVHDENAKLITNVDFPRLNNAKTQMIILMLYPAKSLGEMQSCVQYYVYR